MVGETAGVVGITATIFLTFALSLRKKLRKLKLSFGKLSFAVKVGEAAEHFIFRLLP